MNFNKIKILAKEKKITLSDIASKIGMTQEGFSRSLSDENLKVTSLEKIAEILKVDVREFFGENNIEKAINQVQIGGNGNSQYIAIGECEKEVERLKIEIATLHQVIKNLSRK